MKTNLFISATDQNCEYFAVPMFASFKKHNPDVPMLCVVKNTSLDVNAALENLGVVLIEYREPESFNIRNFSIILYDYVKHIDFDKIMWMDIDALVLEDIRSLFDYKEELVVLPRHLGTMWRYVQPENGMPSIALGTWIATKDAALLMRDLYLKHNPKKITDEGEYIRTIADRFCVRVLDGERFSCCREMTENLEQDDKGPYFMKWGRRQRPAFVHFSLKGNSLRPENFETLKNFALGEVSYAGK